MKLDLENGAECLALVKTFLRAQSVEYKPCTLPGGETGVTVPLKSLALIAARFTMLQGSINRVFDAVRATDPLVDVMLKTVQQLLDAGVGAVPTMNEEILKPLCAHIETEDHGDHMHCLACNAQIPKVTTSAN